MHCAEYGILNLVDIHCYTGERLVHVEHTAMCGVFRRGQLCRV